MAKQIPTTLKSIQPYLMVSKQFEKKDLVVSYYVSIYAIQEGIKLSTGDTDKGFLLSIMDKVEQLKAALKDDDAFKDTLVGQAHVETVALKLFDFADGEDRKERFGKNMIKAFFTASQIFETLKQFGEISVEVSEKTRYAKWKAVEIDRCLKNGITPTPGPPGGMENEDEFGVGQRSVTGDGPGPSDVGPYDSQPGPSSSSQPPPVGFDAPYPPTDPSPYPPPVTRHALPPDIRPVPKPRGHATEEHQPPKHHQDSFGSSDEVPRAPRGVNVGPKGVAQAQKFCKFAASALDYDDIEGAVDFLEKAITLLKTGKE